VAVAVILILLTLVVLPGIVPGWRRASVCAVMAATSSRHRRFTQTGMPMHGFEDVHRKRSRFGRKSYWLAFLIAMNVMLLPSLQRMLNANATSLAILTLLALGTFTAGVHIVSWQICLLGIVMALGVPASAWLEQSAGITDHWVTNASPPISSRMKASTFSAMMDAVTMGNRERRRDSSSSGNRSSIALARQSTGHAATLMTGPLGVPGSYALRTSSTGKVATRAKPSATLPSIRRRKPRRPCVPITIRSAGHRFASSATAS
jgi:hypothetical protein